MSTKVTVKKTKAIDRRSGKTQVRCNMPLFAPRALIALALDEHAASFECDMSAAIALALTQGASRLSFDANIHDLWPLLSRSEREIVIKHNPDLSHLPECTAADQEPLTFGAFKSGPALCLCERAGFNFSEISSWTSFADKFQTTNKEMNGALVERLINMPASSGESAVIQAILHAADYSRFADHISGADAWVRLRTIDSECAAVVAAAVLRQPG